MPSYGEVIYNVGNCYVAPLGLDNAYGTPARIEYLERINLEFESETDEIMSYGTIQELLAVITKSTGSLIKASMNMTALAILCGFSSTSTGTTPNEITTMDFEVGGEGNPYFGMIFTGQSKGGSNVVMGLPKVMLDTLPPFQMEQNRFRRGEINFSAIAPSDIIKKVFRIRRYETAGSVPTTDAGFDTFFTGYFDA